jgi:hypothetical protein
VERTFTSVPDLIAAIRRFIDGWNDRCEPFMWTKTADEILAKAQRNQFRSATLANKCPVQVWVTRCASTRSTRRDEVERAMSARALSAMVLMASSGG